MASPANIHRRLTWFSAPAFLVFPPELAGELVLYVERGGKTLLSWSDDRSVLEPCAAALASAVGGGALGRMSVEKADGGAVYASPLAHALESAGFCPAPRGLRLRA